MFLKNVYKILTGIDNKYVFKTRNMRNDDQFIIRHIAE